MNLSCLLSLLFSYGLLGLVLVSAVFIKVLPLPKILKKIGIVFCTLAIFYAGCSCLSSVSWMAAFLYSIVIMAMIGALAVLVTLFCLMYRYKPLHAIMYDFFWFLKSRVLKNKPSFLNKIILLKHYIRYVSQYILQKEYSKKFHSSEAYADQLFSFKLSFVDYGSMFVMFNEIFGHEVYNFKADSDEPFIIDCGSNIGLAIFYFKTRYPKAHIIGFEPGPETFSFLEKNVTQNNLSDVIVENKAVARKAGQISFYTSKEKPAIGGWSIEGARGHSAYQEHAHQVEATQLSSYIIRPVDLLKIDIEGAEDDVIEELVESGKLSLIKHIILEYHHHMIDMHQDRLARLLQIFEEHEFGYQFNSVEQAVPEKKYRNVLILDVYNKVYKSACEL